MSRWFRFYEDVVNDPKVQRLPGEKFKLWVNLLCVASRAGGVLPPLLDVAYGLRISVERASSLLNELCEKGLLDPVEVDGAPMSYEPHNWNGRQFVSDSKDATAPERMKRYRQRKRNDRNATVTATVTRTDTETEQKKEAANAPPADAETDLYRRGKEVLGKTAGGMIRQLVTVKEGKLNLARAAIETAAGKQDPREYIAGVLRNADQSSYVDGRL